MKRTNCLVPLLALGCGFLIQLPVYSTMSETQSATATLQNGAIRLGLRSDGYKGILITIAMPEDEWPWRVGDRIRSVDGKDVNTPEDLFVTLRMVAPEHGLSLRIERLSEVRDISLKARRLQMLLPPLPPDPPSTDAH